MVRETKKLPLNMQLFAEGSEVQEAELVEVENAGNEDGAQSDMTFDQLLGSNKGYQSDFDRKVQKALDTAKLNWEVKQTQKTQEMLKHGLVKRNQKVCTLAKP